jgi:alginate O-acetyltransferase complex protein AlgJ
MANPNPRAPLGREEIANLEVGHTAIGPRTVRFLVVFFLAVVSVIPFIDAGVLADAVAAAWRVPPVDDGRDNAVESGIGGVWSRMVAGNRRVLAGLNTLERALENDSRLGRALRPPAQVVMTGWLGAGNERTYPGRDGWLFYRPEVEYVTGPGFLDPRQFRRRIESAVEWTSPPAPDPRAAIVQFHQDLAARGIALVVMPAPVKSTVHAEHLARRYADAPAPPQNPSYRAFVDELRRRGVLVFDPADTIAPVRLSAPQYLKGDTHWRPETMEVVAEELASFITARLPLAAAADPGYRLDRVEVRSIGDIARMLDLPDDSWLTPAESVWVRRVLLADGSLWRPSRDADVLLLGDSFSNIYTLESMGWGTSAGFAEQLSYALQRPVDRIVQNDEGAFATRALLAQDPARLNGKRVVVYQFSARELAFGDWRVIPIAR